MNQSKRAFDPNSYFFGHNFTATGTEEARMKGPNEVSAA